RSRCDQTSGETAGALECGELAGPARRVALAHPTLHGEAQRVGHAFAFGSARAELELMARTRALGAQASVGQPVGLRLPVRAARAGAEPGQAYCERERAVHAGVEPCAAVDAGKAHVPRQAQAFAEELQLSVRGLERATDAPLGAGAAGEAE